MNAETLDQGAPLPTPNKLDVNPRFMLDGSLDWYWFHEQSAILEAWFDAGMCIYCGTRPKNGGMAICEEPDCDNIRVLWETLPWPRQCSFCGATSKVNGGRGGPTMIVFINYCDNCGDRKIPKREDAVGQARMF